MCVICVEMIKGTMTSSEARRATLEMPPSPHSDEVQDLIEETATKEEWEKASQESGF